MDVHDTGGAHALSAEAAAEAFLQFLAARHEHGEGDADGDRTLDTTEAVTLAQRLADRLWEEYRTERSRFDRRANGGTSLPREQFQASAQGLTRNEWCGDY